MALPEGDLRGRPRTRLEVRLEAMRASGMSATAMRRALGLTTTQAIAQGLITPWPSAPTRQSNPGTGSGTGPAMMDVVEAVARVHGVDRAALLSRDQRRSLSRARQLAVYLLRELCAGASLPAIGCLLGRDHTTVLYGLRRARALLVQDPTFRARLDRVRRALCSGASGAPDDDRGHG